MTLDNIIDTLLNLWVFAFIGILIWLYFKKEPGGDKVQIRENEKES